MKMIRRSFKKTMLVLFVLFFISSFLIKANSVSLALFSEEGAANYELLRDCGIYKNEYRRRPGIKNKKRKISYSRIRSRQSFKKGRNRLYRIRKVRRTNYSNYGTNVNYYNNTNGYVVQSPTYYNNRPPGATARCRDGTYSFSQSRCGTCSGHGGVAEWY